MTRAAAIALVAAASLVAVARADPAAPAFELPEQPPPLGPASMIVQVDTGVVTGVPSLDARSATMTVGLRARAGKWMLGLEAGGQYWSDRVVGVGTHRTRGLQRTNLILDATRWHRLARARLIQLGGHLAYMAGLAHGLPNPLNIYAPDDETGDIKAPSQLVRVDAMPYEHPAESALKLGAVARLDTARWLAQLELSYNATFVEGFAPDATVPSRWLVIAGAGYRPARSLAVVANVLAQRRVNNHHPSNALVLGAGLHLAVPRGAVSVRAEQRIDDCDLGEWLPGGARTATCSRIAADYTLRF